MDRECQWCGTQFQTANFWSKARFCTNRCRCAWNADRKRQQRNAERMVNSVNLALERLKLDPDDPLLSEAINEIRTQIYWFDNREEGIEWATNHTNS